ncbi:stage III sporulation protein SpoIIIAB [Desulforamulus hydrothermalis]|uniref:Stage III sporulation protein AB n=1 Tax=Desulforamulus hydrothermalis Lam5 = DSM 18033 TaxID=1121428 RepID=K8EK41_9FIRM|nr:stage III sporulation protein SpoIIIAB [Desulforamulus hydrothermalis]CCO08906.1 Stage III sporulation protein AB [Desulforamulus hydrothermalis Lam5 = DSM 18033]SHG74457.1 stage III sporulation protein AB [Desulforamulus hydrothermalis Lam5 = DSM 18033]
MLKFIGAAAVLLSCTLMGLLVAGSYSRRPVEIRCLLNALQMLETEVTYGATPLPEALAAVAERCDPRVALLFNRAAQELLTMRGLTAREAWEAALREFYPGSALTNSERAILLELGNSLGISDRSDQVKHLVLAKEQLKLEQAKAEEASLKNSKVYNYLGFLGGLTIVLILI